MPLLNGIWLSDWLAALLARKVSVIKSLCPPSTTCLTISNKQMVVVTGSGSWCSVVTIETNQEGAARVKGEIVFICIYCGNLSLENKRSSQHCLEMNTAKLCIVNFEDAKSILLC